MHFHLSSREPYFLYKFLNSRPPWQSCCLLPGFQHFFIFNGNLHLQTLLQKATTIQGRKNASVLEHQTRGKNQNQTPEWRSTGIPGPPTVMEKRCHCLAAEVRTQAHSSTKTRNMHTPLLGKTDQTAAYNSLLVFRSRCTEQTLIF